MNINDKIDSFYYFAKFANDKPIDLTDLDSFSLSAVMRKLNQQCDHDTIKDFLKVYLDCFNELADEEDFEELVLKTALEKFSSKIIKKEASIDTNQLSTHMSNIIKLLVEKIKPENRHKAIMSIKSKLSNVDINDMANKNMPASTAIGQSITLVKNVLFDKQPALIKDIITKVINKL